MKKLRWCTIRFSYQFFLDFFTGTGFSMDWSWYFFHALDFVFHGLDFAEIFHGNILFFTGCLKDFFTGRIKFSRVENWFFSRVTKFFSRGKKKHWNSAGITTEKQTDNMTIESSTKYLEKLLWYYYFTSVFGKVEVNSLYSETDCHLSTVFSITETNFSAWKVNFC